MSGSLEEAYVDVERAYGEGDFSTALVRAEALQPQVTAGRPDLLDQRLQLLIGHIHLYGLNRPSDAGAAYAAVLASATEPAYRALASQGLGLSQQHQAAAQPQPMTQPMTQTQTHSRPAATTEPHQQPESQQPAAAEAALPATPWLDRLQDPQQALRDIQAAWVTVVPASKPPPRQGGEPSSPWQGQDSPPPTRRQASPPQPTSATSAEDQNAIVPVMVSVEAAPAQTAATAAPEPAAEPDPLREREPNQGADDEPEPSTPGFNAAEWADLCSGLLLVDLTGSSMEAAPTR